MCDQTEVNYKEGDIVWVKLGSYFWPGEVHDVDKLDEEILVSFKKKPIAAVKFFDEDKYEYVKNLNQICLYNCRKKHDYIKKGLDMYRKQKEGSYMDKFPDDVRKAEMRTSGNPDILSDPQFLPQEKSSYHGIFGTEKKGRHSMAKQTSTASTNGRRSLPALPVRTPPRLITITHPRFIKGEIEHKVHIRQQPVSSPEKGKSPSTSTSATAAYRCQLCDFTSNRLNVIVLHNKFHSANTDTSNNPKGKGSSSKSKPSTPKVRVSTASVETKGKIKSKVKSPCKEPETPPKISSPVTVSPQVSSPPRGTAVKRKIFDGNEICAEETNVEETKTVVIESPEKKRPKTPDKSQDVSKSPGSGKRKGSRGEDKAIKKMKNDEEIREKLLADWDDEDAEQEEKEMELLKQKLLKGDNGTASDSNDTTHDVSIDVKSNESKAASCFDFDDSKDAILDSELEERAKKFVENRKIPRVIDEKSEKLTFENNKQAFESPAIQNTLASTSVTETEPSASAEEFDEAINTLLAETTVPELPQVPSTISEPCKSSSLLPDVVLDSSLAASNESKTEVVRVMTAAEFQGGDHDYSARHRDEELPVNSSIGEDDMLDINSMPVVMADAVVVEEPTTSQVPGVSVQMPKIDLIPNPNAANTHTILMSDGRMAMPPSVQSVVKAVRSSTVDRSKMPVKTVVSVSQVSGNLSKIANRTGSNTSKLQSSEILTPARGARLLQQGIASGKYVIVQPAGNSQPRLTPISNMSQKVSVKPVASTSQQQVSLQSTGSSGKVVIITKPQSGGQQQVLTALTPAQQKALVAGGKLPPPQRLLTSTGQLLTPVNPRNVMAKGTKLTPITGQQMRTLTVSGKQTLGPKLQMQSLQTKIILPSMEKVKIPLTQPQPTVRMVNTSKPQSNTILIQATQSSSVLSSIVSKVSSTTSQLSPRLAAQPKQQRPRLLTSATMLQQAAGKPTQVLSSNPKMQQMRPAFQPRMLMQKPRTTSVLANVRNEVQPVSQGSRLIPRSQVVNQISQAQVPKQFISVTRPTLQPVQKTIQTRPSLLGSKQKVSTSRQPVQKTTLISSPIVPRTNTIELMTTQPLPPLATLQLAATSSNEVITLSQTPGISMPSFQTNISEHLVPTSAASLGDAAAPTYVLLTIDEAGNLQPYNSQSLISYDGSDQAGQTLYIDSSSLESGGDLDNLILTIGNSSSLALDMAQTSTVTNVSSIYNPRTPSSSQDILAAALANTDVFQSEVSLQDTLTVVNSNRSAVMTPCVVESSVLLSSQPPSLLLPSLNRPADVSETSLTLNQPIMTPLEVPSSVVPIHAPPPISFPMELPLTVTQSLSVPVSSYTVVNENVPTSEPIFQPSMPLLSEEITEAAPTTTSSHLSRSQLTYDTIQEHVKLSPYNDGTMELVQETDLPCKQVIYQTQLSAKTSVDLQCTQQTDPLFNTPHSAEPHSPTSTVLSSQSSGKCSPALPMTTSEEINAFSLKVLDSSTAISVTSSSVLSTTSETSKVADSLPSSVMSTQDADNPESLIPTVLPVQTSNQSNSLIPSVLPIEVSENPSTEMSPVLSVQPSEECNSSSPTQTVSDTTSRCPPVQFGKELGLESTLKIDDNLDQSNNIPVSDNSQNEHVMKMDSGNMQTIPEHNDPTIVSVSNKGDHAVYMPVPNKVVQTGMTMMETEVGSNILETFLEMPSNPSKAPTETAGEEVGGVPQSMPLLSEDSSFNLPADRQEQLGDKANLEDCSKDSQYCTDSSANEIGFEESDR